MKVTYLFGAGASFNAVPIIGELNKAFVEIGDICINSNDRNTLSAVTTLLKNFKITLDQCSSMTEIFGTIDTYAKKLSLTNVDELNKTKAALSLFFTLWQEIPKSQLKKRIDKETGQMSIPYLDIDNRYTSLLANYLESKDGEIKLADNVNFLTWNYDTQLERAIGLYSETTLNKTLASFKVYPYITSTKPRILHLNGIAGLYKEKKSSLTTETLFCDNKNINPKFLIENMFEKLISTQNNIGVNEEFYTYAWENDSISINALNYADEILKETNVLVIIGYSFPTFNDSVDKRMFQTLKESKNFKMVYYQDPNADEEILISRFGIDKEKIKIVNKTDQFTLPLESHTINQNAKGDFFIPKVYTFNAGKEK